MDACWLLLELLPVTRRAVLLQGLVRRSRLDRTARVEQDRGCALLQPRLLLEGC
jgi:hypothetical protein